MSCVLRICQILKGVCWPICGGEKKRVKQYWSHELLSHLSTVVMRLGKNGLDVTQSVTITRSLAIYKQKHFLKRKENLMENTILDCFLFTLHRRSSNKDAIKNRKPPKQVFLKPFFFLQIGNFQVCQMALPFYSSPCFFPQYLEKAEHSI